MTVSGEITDIYNEISSGGDPRVTSWPLMRSPVPIVALIISYILVVKLLGPIWMKNKEPFDLRYTMFLYNMALVVKNNYLLYKVFGILLNGKQSWICRVDDANDPDSLRMAELGWWFTCLKIVEFADTIFFVLRKKYNQISLLHVIHHSTMPIACWIGLRLDPGSYNYFFCVINSMVHVVMYTYYGLAALGPGVKKYLWWKKYLTVVQMMQFIVIILYVLLLMALNCRVPKIMVYLVLFFGHLFLVLFANFFWRSYRDPARRLKRD